jgi:hexosaminidase
MTDSSRSNLLYAEAWSSFLNIVGKRALPMLDYYKGGYNYRVPKPGLVLEEDKWAANIQFPGMLLRYTTDGKEPDNKSLIYKDPVTSSGKNLQCRAFNSRERGGAIAGE